MRKGVDITKLDWLPINGEGGMELSIIDYTCNDSKAKKRSSGGYIDPDQVNNIVVRSSGTLQSRTQIYRTARDYQNTLSVSADIDFAGGLFSASASYERMRNTIQKTEKYVQENQVHVSLFNVELRSPLSMTVSSDANKYIERWPSEITEDNIDQFLEVISKYGTHFIQTAKFGGTIRFISETQQTYYLGHSEDKIKAAIGGMVSSFTGSAAFGYSAADIDEEFNAKTSWTVRYFGGEKNLLSNGSGFEEWQPTIEQKPWLYSGTLVPIYELIKNDSQRELMRSASEIYLAKAHLNDVKKKIEPAENLTPSFPFMVSIFDKLKEDILDKIRPLEAEVLLKQNDVIDLACEIMTDINDRCDNSPIEEYLDSIFAKEDDRRQLRPLLKSYCKRDFEKAFSLQGL